MSLLVPVRIAAPVIALVAGSVLAWEILLTRLASLRYHFHFGFLAVSLGLLGIGLSGAVLAVWGPRWRANPRLWLRCLSLGYLTTLVLGVVGLYALPVHLGRMDVWGTISFGVFALLGGLPFLLGGGVIGFLLGVDPSAIHRRYGIDLVAAGTGCLLVLQVLEAWGAGGALAVIVAAAVVVASITAPAGWRQKSWAVWALVLLGLGPSVDAHVPAPSKIVRPILHTTWTRLSRVDAVRVAADARTVRARGRPVEPGQVPPQVELMQDGSASTLLTDYTGHPTALWLLEDTLFSAAVRLRPDARVLVIGVGGGDDVWAALHHGARRIHGVDLHAPMVEAHGPGGRGWTKAWGDRVDLVVAEGRSELMRNQDHYDVIQMTGIDTWAAVTSGAYALAENTLYTTEAFEQMLDRLAPGGILQVIRMAAEMEALRVLAHVDVASASRRAVPFEQTVMVLGSADHQVATLVRPDGFTEAEVASVAAWAESAGMVVHHLPGRLDPGLISTFVRTPDRAAFIDAFPRNIAPTDDDSPYFFSFTRWSRPGAAAQTIREPTYISQGNPLFILGHLMVSVLAAGLALLMAHRRRRGGPVPAKGALVFFAMVGVGFIGIELGLMQKLGLFLGHPMLSLSITLAGLLVAAGGGALLSARWPLHGHRIWWIPVGIALWLAVLLAGLQPLMSATITTSVAVRCGLALAVLVPGGLLLGVPFAWGLARVPVDVVPWAWAVNGFFTVIGAVLTVVVSMVWGFSWVLWGSVAAYFAAFAAWKLQEIGHGR